MPKNYDHIRNWTDYYEELDRLQQDQAENEKYALICFTFAIVCFLIIVPLVSLIGG